jgi:hypothetical protein
MNTGTSFSSRIAKVIDDDEVGENSVRGPSDPIRKLAVG